MNTIDQILDRAAAKMAKDIDDEILMSTMGWHELILDEGRVYGSRYLTVHPSNGWHWNEMMAWMIDTFGPSGTKDKPMVWTPDQRWYANNAKFWFRDKQDLEWFVLKWA
jgi:hypothetical protein